jgi:hypothetical protein
MRFVRIVIALSLPYIAWQIHHKAIAILDEAIDAPRTIHNPLPKERAGDYFGESSRELVKKPEVQVKLRYAQGVDLSALACLLASPVLLVSAFIRPRPQPEQEPCAPVEPS